MITLTLPYPPSVNNLYATVRGRKILSAKGREYHQKVVDSVFKQVGAYSFGAERVSYSCVAFPPDHRRRDISNLIKIVEDSLTRAEVWDDDSQVDSLSWSRGHVAPGGSLFLTIEVFRDHGSGNV